MSSRVRFFDELAEGLPNDTWGRRLQEELDAHLEDAVLFATLEGIPEQKAEADAVTRLGNPKQIIHEFRHAMTYKSLSAFVLHAVAVGLFISPVVYLCALLAHSPVLIPIIFGVLYAFYSFGLRPVMRHIEGRKLRVQLAIIASFVPILLLGLPVTTGLLNPSFTAPQDVPWLLLGCFLVACLTIAAAMTAVWEPISQTKDKLINGLSLLLVGMIVFLMGLFHGTIPQEMNALEGIRFMLSSAVTVPNGIAELMPPVTAGWVSGIIALGIGFIALFFVVQSLDRKRKGEKESFPWAWSLIALFMLSIVFLPGTAPDIQNVAWSNVPHVNLSEIIERKELGPFYKMTKYLNQSNSNSFLYNASVEEGAPTNGFLVKQSLDRAFAIANIKSVNDFTMTESTHDFDGATWSTPGIWCHQKAIPGTIVEYGDINGNVIRANVEGEQAYLSNTSPLYCSDLYVGDKKIFDVTNGATIDILQATLSLDGKWMLFAHDTDTEIHGQLSPTEVYLIDLR